MIRLIRAEVRKLMTTQVWFWLLVASVAITAIAVSAQIATAPSDHELASRVRDIFTTGNVALIAVFVLGVLGVTSEFRYQTITPTLLATPSRWLLITAKLITYALIGAAYALVCVVVQLLIAVPWLSSKDIGFSFADNIGGLVSVFVVVTLYALLGLGAGALLRNQIVAVSVGLIVLLIVENLIMALPHVRSAYPYIPAGAATAISTASDASRVTDNGVHLLPIWGGVVTLLVWSLGMALVGAGTTMNRDIT